MSEQLNTTAYVIHAAFEGMRGENPKVVATVRMTDDNGDTRFVEDHEEILNYAYRHTNNVAGSWSRGPIIEGPEGDDYPNGDFSPSVEALQANKVIDGQEWGQRSTSVGDLVIVTETGHDYPEGQSFRGTKSKLYQVANFGFTEVPMLQFVDNMIRDQFDGGVWLGPTHDDF